MRYSIFSNIFFYISTKNVIASFSGQSSEFEDYNFEGSSEGSSDLGDYSLDYQGQDRRLSLRSLSPQFYLCLQKLIITLTKIVGQAVLLGDRLFIVV